MNSSAEPAVLGPSGLVTMTSTVPDPAGAVAMTWVPEVMM